jgi:maltooligosyltrehalose trehalohydrolase
MFVNLGADLELDAAPEPLLAPPAERRWRLIWSSEDPIYGGLGNPPVESDDEWRIPGRAAVVLASETFEPIPVDDEHEKAGP